jgi:hypothetical protein
MGEKEAWYLNPIAIIALLFLMLGPFALPLLYQSRGFSKIMKVSLTALVLIYTAYLFYASFKLGMSWGSKF